jgi:hypothetical protein
MADDDNDICPSCDKAPWKYGDGLCESCHQFVMEHNREMGPRQRKLAATFEGVCLPHEDAAEANFAFVRVTGTWPTPYPGHFFGATDFTEALKIEATDTDVYYSFRRLNSTDPDVDEMVADFRSKTGRKYPLMYRTKITVEMTPVDDEELEILWKEWQV